MGEPTTPDNAFAAFVVNCAHYSIDGIEETDDGFYTATCACDYQLPPCPDRETAVDGLMQHAYEAGILTERATHNA